MIENYNKNLMRESKNNFLQQVYRIGQAAERSSKKGSVEAFQPGLKIPRKL